MGFWKDLWDDDDWCVHIRIVTGLNAPHTNQRNVMKLIQENKELKKQLQAKRLNAIDVDYQLLGYEGEDS